MVTNDLSSRQKLRKVFKKYCRKNPILGLRISKKLKVQKWPQKIPLRAHNKELWAKYFSRTRNLTIFKSTSVNKKKCKHHKKKNQPRKYPQMQHPLVTNDLSSGRKLRKVFKKKIMKKLKVQKWPFSLFESEWTPPYEKPFSPFGVQ